MKTKKLIIILLLSLAFLVWQQRPDNNFHLIFCDVGQGDAILLVHKNNQILIDGGPNDAVLNCLANNIPFWDRNIEMVILTHPDADHYGGLPEVFKRFKIQKLVSNPIGKKDDLLFKSLISTLIEQKIDTHFLVQGDKIKLDLIEIDLVWPSESKLLELESIKTISEKTENGFLLVDESLINANEFSLGAKVSFGQFEALLLGDLPGIYAQTLAWQNKLPKVEVLKAPHHGSGLDNPDELYQATKPQLVVISVGKNTFGHPSAELLEKLNNLEIKVKRTDENGEVEIISDGKIWWLK
ncbi:MBL fold metallo-hydrolase [Candidatus Shapirobacteria bacterium]|nr:MBL fold metallo-hydrolase [Candidatus Shapirobacteria bacterium]